MQRLKTICSFIGNDDFFNGILRQAEVYVLVKRIYDFWGIDAFYIDRRSKFSLFCEKAILRLKKKYSDIKIIYNEEISSNFCVDHTLILKSIINFADVLVFNRFDNFKESEMRRIFLYARYKGKILYRI